MVIVAFAICIGLMLLSWFVARRLNFFSLVDVVWTYGIGFIAVFYSFVGAGNTQRRLGLSVLALFWSLRLGTHLLFRLKAKFPIEDPRYLELKEKWEGSSQNNFFWFYQYQALSQPILCLPFFLAAQDPKPLGVTDAIAFAICLISVVGEATADYQLRKFKKNPSNRSQVCEVGLWRYSRHPNYFFEWLTWCGFSIFAWQSPYWFLALLSPVVMYILLNFVTGVPPSEIQSIKSKGDLYRDYQRRVSRFFLWPPLRKDL